MATNLIRIQLDGAERWGVVTASGITLLAGAYATTAALIEQGEADWRAASMRPAGISLDSAVVLSPVTAPCRIYCQGANYRQHMIESGIDPDKKSFNMFFTKSDASIASGRAAVRPPAHVKLLDYEIELALIFKRSGQLRRSGDGRHAEGLRIRDRGRKRPQRARRATAPDAILQRQELSRLLPDRSLAHRARARRVRLPRRSATAAFGQWEGAPARHDDEPGVQACGDDFRADDVRQYRAGRRASHRNAQRLRAARSAACPCGDSCNYCPSRRSGGCS